MKSVWWIKKFKLKSKKTKPIIGKIPSKKGNRSILLAPKDLFEGKDGSFYQENY